MRGHLEEADAQVPVTANFRSTNQILLLLSLYTEVEVGRGINTYNTSYASHARQLLGRLHVLEETETGDVQRAASKQQTANAN